LGFLLCAVFVQGQRSTSGAGTVAQGDNGQISFVVGQINYTSLVNSSSLSGGVLQVYYRTPLVVIEKSEVSVWPNPVLQYLYLQVEASPQTDISYQILDLFGRSYEKTKLINLQAAINMQNYAAGIYFLKLILPNQTPISFKVLKL
jgi:hypothetical protein